MCGRYSLEIRPDFGDRFMLSNVPLDLKSHYNIAPSLREPVIVRNSPNRVEMMLWGLIPSWSKDGKPFVINARGETIRYKKMFYRLLKANRCIIPATGFYEWQKTKDGKVPYYFSLKDDSYFSFAGLYDKWVNKAGEEIHSYVIITTEANEIMSPVHDRMPVMFDEKSEDLWLSKDTNEEDLLAMLTPYPADLMKKHPVSTMVNRPYNDDKDVTLSL
ncbi:MAG: SOS response-associated peptidase [Patescibacteria group bacterium]